MIWIIGGTSEARELVDRLKNKVNYIITIATEGGREFLDSENVYVGRLNKEEMLQFAAQRDITAIVDLSHPYAKIVSKNAKEISEELGIEYLRFVRSKSKHGNDVISLNSYEECYDYLQEIEGTVFFTTGSKNIGDFEKIKGSNRFIYRILPAYESIMECRKFDIKMEDIVALLGPFSLEFNKIMFHEYDADYVIMKDSGAKGGTLEKINACKELGIRTVIIDREEEDGFYSLEYLEKVIIKKFKKD
ncbi:precorrin-6A reductase [Paratissierella segnis]|jgi:precorrin-6A/cobalt-precorrin-6A reductase|uniref:Precorrin-6A reductase n=1 Tax=Paratissierella segnis TaxID=2763679 RepID=A0A926EXL5_9FIRM|nr:precorrin-6A reductase [Paratissierella segnis]MBC8589446.1 precorrin-6A reductase [Paratissierella segnis]